MTNVQFHEDATHAPSVDWSDEYDKPAGGVFIAGREYNVPDDAADYFKRAGWASDPGEQPVKPDPTKPVLVDVKSSKIGVSSKPE